LQPVRPSLHPAWSRSDLKRPGPLLAAIAAFVVTAPLATVVACNVHELGHAAVATMLGWEVERIYLCRPAGGSVVYAHVGTWAGNAQGYAGGFAAAGLLVGTYLVAIARPARPLGGPGWWFAGLGLILPVGPQVVLGVLEGAVQPGEDYTERYATVIQPLVFAAMAVGVAAYTWRWRAVWKQSGTVAPPDEAAGGDGRLPPSP
jgi:hypothetical protein